MMEGQKLEWILIGVNDSEFGMIRKCARGIAHNGHIILARYQTRSNSWVLELRAGTTLAIYLGLFGGTAWQRLYYLFAALFIGPVRRMPTNR